MPKRTAADARDARINAGVPTLDDALGFESTLTVKQLRPAGRDAAGRRYYRRPDTEDDEEFVFRLPPRRADGPEVEPPEIGERIHLKKTTYVVTEMHWRPDKRKNTGVVFLERMMAN